LNLSFVFFVLFVANFEPCLLTNLECRFWINKPQIAIGRRYRVPRVAGFLRQRGYGKNDVFPCNGKCYSDGDVARTVDRQRQRVGCLWRALKPSCVQLREYEPKIRDLFRVVRVIRGQK